jgi:hypothetical protein
MRRMKRLKFTLPLIFGELTYTPCIYCQHSWIVIKSRGVSRGTAQLRCESDFKMIIRFCETRLESRPNWHCFSNPLGYSFSGQLLSNVSKEFVVGPLNSTRLLRSSGLSAIVPRGHPPNDAWLHLTLQTNDGKHTNEQFFHPVDLKDCLLRPTKVLSRPMGHNQISLQVAHGGVAAWVNGKLFLTWDAPNRYSVLP